MKKYIESLVLKKRDNVVDITFDEETASNIEHLYSGFNDEGWVHKRVMDSLKDELTNRLVLKFRRRPNKDITMETYKNYDASSQIYEIILRFKKCVRRIKDGKEIVAEQHYRIGGIFEPYDRESWDSKMDKLYEKGIDLIHKITVHEEGLLALLEDIQAGKVAASPSQFSLFRQYMHDVLYRSEEDIVKHKIDHVEYEICKDGVRKDGVLNYGRSRKITPSLQKNSDAVKRNIEPVKDIESAKEAKEAIEVEVKPKRKYIKKNQKEIPSDPIE